MPQITVIIPALDFSEPLLETINSIHHDGFMAIIVSPYSAMFKLQNHFSDIDWVDLVVEEGKGIYAAFNTGLKAAKSDYVMFAGAGDYINASVVSELLQSGNVAREQINFGFVNSDGVLRRKVCSKSTLLRLDSLITSHSVGMLISTRLHKKIGFYKSEFPISADYDFMIRALELGVNFKLLDEVFGFWPSGGASSQQSGFKKSVEHRNIRKTNALRFYNLLFFLNFFDFIFWARVKNYGKRALNLR
jgi:glycosyltransferase involved in cell wall biosynthesis